MNKTLLEYVNYILSAMDSDTVNSISDTVEAEQVAQIVRNSYEAMMSNRNWPHLKQAIKLSASGSLAKPSHMILESSVKELLFINYNSAAYGETRKKYLPIKWREPDEFLRAINNRNSDSDTVDIIQDYSGVELLITNDKAPNYFTTFDDTHIVFDSYDSAVESTLQSSKVQAQGYVFPTWVHDDSAIPDLPQEAESALLAEAMSSCMFKLKQMQDVKSEQEAGRQQRWLARKAWRTKGGVRYPNFGRVSRK